MPYRGLILLLVTTLSACVSVPKPMETETVKSIKSGKSAVAFLDVNQKINYLEDHYLVLGVAQTATNSDYTGIWNSHSDLAKIHAEELSKIGVNATSIYENMSADEISESLKIQREMYDVLVASDKAAAQQSDDENTSENKEAASTKKSTTVMLNQNWRQHLINQGYNYLFWLNWSGLTMHLPTLGLSTNKRDATGYVIFDLEKNTKIWEGSIFSFEKLDLGESTGKDFLEKNNLAGLKREVEKMTRNRYQDPLSSGTKRETVGEILGIQEKKPEVVANNKVAGDDI